MGAASRSRPARRNQTGFFAPGPLPWNMRSWPALCYAADTTVLHAVRELERAAQSHRRQTAISGGRLEFGGGLNPIPGYYVARCRFMCAPVARGARLLFKIGLFFQADSGVKG